MLLVHPDTQWSWEVESTANQQLSIFMKIARALKLYCRYEGKQKKSTKAEGVQPNAVMGRLYGDALQDDYDPMNEDEDEELNRNESQDYELSLRDAQQLDDEEEEEEESASCRTTNSVSASQKSMHTSSHLSITTGSNITVSPRHGSGPGVKGNHTIYL